MFLKIRDMPYFLGFSGENRLELLEAGDIINPLLRGFF